MTRWRDILQILLMKFCFRSHVCSNDFVMGGFCSTSSCQIRTQKLVVSVLTRRHGHQLMMMVTLKLLQDIPGDMQRHLVAGPRSRVPFATFEKLCLSEPYEVAFPEWGE